MFKPGHIHGLASGCKIIPSGIDLPCNKKISPQSGHIGQSPVADPADQLINISSLHEHIQFIKDPHKKDQRKTKGVPEKRTEQLPSYIITFKVLIYREDFSALMLFKHCQICHCLDFFFIQHKALLFLLPNAINLVYHIFFCFATP
jgi:hypothetical protein